MLQLQVLYKIRQEQELLQEAWSHLGKSWHLWTGSICRPTASSYKTTFSWGSDPPANTCSQLQLKLIWELCKVTLLLEPEGLLDSTDIHEDEDEETGKRKMLNFLMLKNKDKVFYFYFWNLRKYCILLLFDPSISHFLTTQYTLVLETYNLPVLIWKWQMLIEDWCRNHCRDKMTPCPREWSRTLLHSMTGLGQPPLDCHLSLHRFHPSLQ